jgi:YD repeat-containing protein
MKLKLQLASLFLLFTISNRTHVNNSNDYISLVMRGVAKHFVIIVFMWMSVIGIASATTTTSATFSNPFTQAACDAYKSAYTMGLGNCVPSLVQMIGPNPGIIVNIVGCCLYGTNFNVSFYLYGIWSCQAGFSLSGTNCTLPANTPDPTKNTSAPPLGSCQGNPCNAGSGNKYQHETDYIGEGTFPLHVERFYNSGGCASSAVGLTVWGNQWRGYYDRSIAYASNGVSLKTATLTFNGGKQYYFNQSIGIATPPLTTTTWTPDADLVGNLIETGVDAYGNPVGWTFTNEDDEVETYNAAGTLVMITNSAGLTQILTYSDGTAGANGAYMLDAAGANTTSILPAGFLIRVTDSSARTIQFGYDVYHRVVKITDPAGGAYNYSYAVGNTLTSVTFPDGHIRTYLYGEVANVAHVPATGVSFWRALTGIMDDGVRSASWTYDAQGRAASSEHGAFGSGIDHVGLMYATPDVNGNSTTSVTDSLGTVRSYGFSTLLNVVKNTGISGQPCKWCSAAMTYDFNGNVASRTDFNGNTICYAFDQSRNLELNRLEGLSAGVACPAVLSTYIPTAGTAQRLITTQWNATYRLPTVVAEPMRITADTYDAQGNLLTKTVQATTDAAGALGVAATVTGVPRTWTYTYNIAGQVLTVDGPRTDVSDITNYTYDAQQNLDTVTNALSQTTTLGSYDANGRPSTITDANGLLTDLVYDARGRLTSRTTGGETTTYAYDGVGQLINVAAPSGASYTYTYDAAHRLTEIADNQGNHINYTLDVMGNRTLEQTYNSSGSLVRTHSRVFDALNRLFQDIGSVNQTTTFAYDANGNLTNVTDPLNRQTVRGYDALNRLITNTDAASGNTQYGYDNLDQLVKVTDPKTLSTQYQRDGLGNLTQQTSPDTGITANTFDAAGNVLTRTDAKGQVTVYIYDALNRLTGISYKASAAGSVMQTVAYQYDQGTNGIGHLTQITDSTGTTNYSYDQHGRLNLEQRQAQSLVYSTVYSYDTAGRLISIGYPSGRLVSYTFDSMGRTTQISTTLNGTSKILASSVAYEPFGGVQSFYFGDGITAPVQSYVRQRDQDGRISSYTLNGKVMTIAYDTASQISSITNPQNLLNPATYGYDALSRLNSFLYGSTSQAYYYDADGNRTSQILGSTTTYSYGTGTNRLTGIQLNTAAVQPITQDANGSTTADLSRQYSYDLRGRLVQVTTAQGVISYEVNALGLRVHKKVPYAGTDTLYHYDSQGHLIGESPLGSATFTREYIYLGDQPVAVMK